MIPLYHEHVPNAPGIYKITCTATGKFYIGSAINLRLRRATHFGYLQRNTHHNPKLQAAFNKYGPESFTFEVLETVLVPEMLTAREQYWLDKCKPFGKRGFNLVRIAGSSLGLKHTSETKEKLRNIKLGQPNGCLGTKRSNESKEIMRLKARGNNSHAKAFIVIDPDGVEYAVHGLERFCREHHLNATVLGQVAKGKYKHHQGWRARYPESSTG